MFDLMKKVVESQSKVASLNRFRLKNNIGMATDQVTYVCINDLPFENIDCMVDATTFTQVVNDLTNLTITQESGKLVIVSGPNGTNVSEIGTEPITSLLDVNETPTGTEIEIGNLLEALKALKPFNGSTLYATGGYLYMANASVIVRTPLTTKFKTPIVFITQNVANLLLTPKLGVTGLMDSDTILTILLSNGWIKTAKPAWKLPHDLSGFFVQNNYDKADMKPLEPDFSQSLKRICKFATGADIVHFGPEGIHLTQGTSKKHFIKVPMDVKRAIYPSVFSQVLALNPAMDLNGSEKIIPFKTDMLEGFISCAQG